MLNQVQEPETALRYDSDMQRRVVEIATHLQQQDHDHVTAQQILDAAGEIGLEPHYVQQAIAQARAERVRTMQPSAAVRSATRTTHPMSPTEYRRFLNAICMPMGLGALAYLFKNFTGMAVLLSLILPLPLSCLSGFLTGRKRVGFVTAALLAFALAPTIYHLGIHTYYISNPANVYQSYFTDAARGYGLQAASMYSFVGAPLAGLLGMFGAWMRKKYVPE